MYPEYVPVAERRAKAVRETEKMVKAGKDIQPVHIEGRTIARSFWGKGWCSHLEGFGDYSNRLPRGRTYVRNGSVCHLGIARGSVEALVSGSSLYKVKVAIQELKPDAWTALRQTCTGRIGSLIELLQGRLSDEVMRAVTDPQHGLFPKPGEIKYTCSCPDSASMCKHIAAVMYGIGARLDTQPELLFRLRGVDHEELLSAEAAVGAITGGGSRRTRRRVLDEGSVAAVFGVELEGAVGNTVPGTATATNTATAPETAAAPRPRRSAFRPTGPNILKLRARLGMGKTEFARALGVSAATVTNWEKAPGAVNPQARCLANLKRLHKEGEAIG
jgi:DNA-binding transcriptional regulator YiaG